MWIVKKVQYDDINKGQLAITFRGQALVRYMKFMQVPTGHPQKSLAWIRTRLIEEFKNPKSESLYVTELKEIKQFSNESVWYFDQWFKTLMANISFRMSDVQHKEWFVVALVPHIHMFPMQQKIAYQEEALEIIMKLDSLLV